MAAPSQVGTAPALPPAKEYFVSIDGARMRYLRCGQGRPLLLIHGLLGYSFCWRRNYAELSRHFDVIAPDLLGIGFSDRPPNLDCSLRGAATRMLRFLELLGIELADVVGNSHGGAIAATMTALGSETGRQRVRRLLLAAPVNPWSPYGTYITAMLGSSLGQFCFPAVWSGLRHLRGVFLKRMYGDPSRIPPGSIEGYFAGLATPGTTAYLMGIMHCWHSDLHELETTYRQLTGVPLLLLWGDRDKAVPITSAEHVRQAAPHAELVILPGVGHLPQEEAPDQFHTVVLKFLA